MTVMPAVLFADSRSTNSLNSAKLEVLMRARTPCIPYSKWSTCNMHVPCTQPTITCVEFHAWNVPDRFQIMDENMHVPCMFPATCMVLTCIAQKIWYAAVHAAPLLWTFRPHPQLPSSLYAVPRGQPMTIYCSSGEPHNALVLY